MNQSSRCNSNSRFLRRLATAFAAKAMITRLQKRDSGSCFSPARAQLMGVLGLTGVVAAFFTLPAFAQHNDVQGVAIGMTPKETMAALLSANPNYVLRSTHYMANGRQGPVASIRGCVANIAISSQDCGASAEAAQHDVITVSFGANNGQAFFITRKWEPLRAARPALKAFIEGSESKYGPLSIERTFPDGGTYSTMPNARGKQDLRCRTTAMYGTPNTAHPDCALSVSINGIWDQRTQALAKVQMAMFDHRVLIAEIRRTNAIADARSRSGALTK